MHANKAHPFLKGGYPMFTIKYPPPSLLLLPSFSSLRLVVHPTKISPLPPLTFDPKTVSFMVYFPTSQEDHGHCKRLDRQEFIVSYRDHRRLDLWNGLVQTKMEHQMKLVVQTTLTNTPRGVIL